MSEPSTVVAARPLRSFDFSSSAAATIAVGSRFAAGI